MRTETDALLSLQRYVAAALPDFSEIVTEVEAEAPPVRPFAVVSVDGDWTAEPSPSSPFVTLPVTIYAYVEGIGVAPRTDARRRAEDVREALWHALAVGIGDGRERLVPLFDYSGRPEVQRVTVTGISGTWTLAHDGFVTAPLPARAQPRDVRLALEDAALDLAGNVWVYGKLGGPFDVRFDGALRGQAVPLLEADASQLGGLAPGVLVEEISAGSPDPWRDARDFLRVEQPTFGGLPDPTDPRLRTVTVGVRLTWGRGGHVPSAEMSLRTVTARRI